MIGAQNMCEIIFWIGDVAAETKKDVIYHRNGARMVRVCLLHALIVKHTEIAHLKSRETVSFTVMLMQIESLRCNGRSTMSDRYQPFTYSVMITTIYSIYFFCFWFSADDCQSLRLFIDNCSPVRGLRSNFAFDNIDVDENGNFIPQNS